MAGRLFLVGDPWIRVEPLSLFVRTADVLADAPSVRVGCGVANRSPRACRVGVRWAILDDQGRVLVARDRSETDVAPGGRAEIETSFHVRGIRLWSPDSPVLYRVRCEVVEGNRVWHAIEERFGFRSAEFRPEEGFHLNGERLQLRGVNRHESIPVSGTPCLATSTARTPSS